MLRIAQPCESVSYEHQRALPDSCAVRLARRLAPETPHARRARPGRGAARRAGPPLKACIGTGRSAYSWPHGSASPPGLSSTT
jgi:hypothetical protein